LGETVQFFKNHRAALEAAVAEVRKGGDYETLRKRYLRLTPEGFEHSTSPLIVEFTPVDFYYVLVFAESEDALKQSDAMTDEGAVKRRLGDGWYVVQRGFM
jgi:hypothetical protein